MKVKTKPYRYRCPIDEKASPFTTGVRGGSEVPRMGDHGDIKAASKHSRRRGGY